MKTKNFRNNNAIFLKICIEQLLNSKEALEDLIKYKSTTNFGDNTIPDIAELSQCLTLEIHKELNSGKKITIDQTLEVELDIDFILSANKSVLVALSVDETNELPENCVKDVTFLMSEIFSAMESQTKTVLVA